MNHVQILVRSVVVIFWLSVFGALATMVLHSGNTLSLSWITIFIYAAVTSAVLYVGFFVSKQLWSIK